MEIQSRDGHVSEEAARALAAHLRAPLYQVQALLSFYPYFRARPRRSAELRVCRDLACALAGSERLLGRLQQEAGRRGWPEESVRGVACLGRCESAPCVQTEAGVRLRADPDAPLAATPERAAVSLGCAEEITPPAGASWKIRLYPGEGDYRVLTRLLRDRPPPEPAEMVRAAGLRGMGGAGFPAAVKWDLVRRTAADIKYLVVNADESEPGTFKDRVLLESLADQVLEGALIAARAAGARRGIIYLRHEYAPQRRILEAALGRCRKRGWLGEQILGTDFSFDLEIFDSPGGYICGEETALLEVLEGRRAEPRNKPPFPGESGLWGKPTLIHNVETLAWVPAILERGVEWYAGLGVNGARGAKLVAVSGPVARPGVYEVPLGTPIRALIETEAGGLRDGRALLAFSPGGPSTGFLPAALADTPYDFAPLAATGSMLGSGALVAIPGGTCMVAMAHNALRFFRDESCGKCVPCRLGSDKMEGMLAALIDGRLEPPALDSVADLSDAMAMTSICGLGQAAPLPFTSLLRHFGPEVEAHLEGRCLTGAGGVAPAGGRRRRPAGPSRTV